MNNIRLIETRREAELELEAGGVTGAAAEAILRETAHVRHEWRVRQALDHARDWVRELHPEQNNDSILAGYTLTLLLAELVGIGGREGVEGLGTTRMPWARELGKGRKQARDGAAWNAAIYSAAAMIIDGERWTIQAHAPMDTTQDPPRPQQPIMSLLRESGGDPISVGFEYVDPDWQISIAREGLRRACGLPGWHRVLDDVGIHFDGEPAAWAPIVNDLQNAASETEAAKQEVQL